jgi:GntR family transcriptional regulator, histidine utilization repressor
MNESLPLYVRVKDHIIGQIRSGAWTPGARVPSENELVESFSISRMTANRALRELTSEGFVSRVPGVGTFVREVLPARTGLMELRNIAEEITARGHRYSARLVSRQEVKANPAQAEDFELKEAARLFHIVIVHEENGIPVQLEDRHVNAAAAPDFMAQDFAATTPTAYLVGIAPVDELEHTVEAAMPSPEQQRLLAADPFEPCLVLRRRSWSRGQVVTAVTLTYPASRYALYSRYKTSARGTLVE